MAAMTKQFDVMVLGGGPAGRHVAAGLASGLANGGRSVALVHTGTPSAAALSARALLHSARRAETWESAVARRDALTAGATVPPGGIEILTGSGRVAEPGAVEVDGAEYGCTELVVCTGGKPVVPEVPGLADLPVWTGADALRSPDLPRRLVILGGGAEGCELAHIYASFGSQVVLVEPAARLPAGEAPFAADLLADALRRLGAEVRLGTALEHSERTDTGPRLRLTDGTVLETDRIMLCGPRAPRIPDSLDDFTVDDHCKAGPGIWAAGDVTGLAEGIEAARYQARLVVSNLCAETPLAADYWAVPRVVATTPALYAVGRTPARPDGMELVSAGIDLSETIRAAISDDKFGLAGRVEFYADPARGVLAGAVAAGLYAEDWMGELTLAIRAEIPLSVLADAVHAFPTYGEAMEAPLRELAAHL
jgi:pyruvate/2-oxoglutarate dehydrogenase complex dihydrolipoamide dehydrogenase (E3) component